MGIISWIILGLIASLEARLLVERAKASGSTLRSELSALSSAGFYLTCLGHQALPA